jgi:hypothetical protein
MFTQERIQFRDHRVGVRDDVQAQNLALTSQVRDLVGVCVEPLRRVLKVLHELTQLLRRFEIGRTVVQAAVRLEGLVELLHECPLRHAAHASW